MKHDYNYRMQKLFYFFYQDLDGYFDVAKSIDKNDE